MNTPQKEKIELFLDSEIVEALKAHVAEENSSLGEVIEKILGVSHHEKHDGEKESRANKNRIFTNKEKP